MMLNHIGQPDIATKVHNAWLKTIEDGIHTYDIFKEGTSKEKVGTKEFGEAVIARVGQKPSTLKAVDYSNVKASGEKSSWKYERPKKARKDLVGVDIFLHWANGTADDLGEILKKVTSEELKLLLISNRGVKVWPDGFPETFCTDHWRCRYTMAFEGSGIKNADIIKLLTSIDDAGFDVIKTENLYKFDGELGYSLSQGQ